MIVVVVKVNNGVGATTFSLLLAKHLNALFIDADVRHPRYPEKGGWLALSLGKREVCGMPVEVVEDGGVKALPGGDAHAVYTGLCDEVDKSELYDQLFSLLQVLELKNINVVADAGAVPEKKLPMFKRFKIIYIDDARLFSPSERQKTVAEAANIVIVNKSPKQQLPDIDYIKRKTFAVVPQGQAYLEEVAKALVRAFK